MVDSTIFYPAPYGDLFAKQKKKKGYCVLVYGRFLNRSIVAAKPITIVRIIAIAAVRMYVSVGGRLISGYGDAVGAGLLTLMYVCADEPPYDVEPWKVAMIWYVPGTCGVQSRP
jgi:hypothetical protein